MRHGPSLTAAAEACLIAASAQHLQPPRSTPRALPPSTHTYTTTENSYMATHLVKLQEVGAQRRKVDNARLPGEQPHRSVKRSRCHL